MPMLSFIHNSDGIKDGIFSKYLKVWSFCLSSGFTTLATSQGLKFHTSGMGVCSVCLETPLNGGSDI